MNLCFITEYQHFSVCSAVANELAKKLDDTVLSRILKRHNYIWKIRRRCVTKTIIDDEKGLRTNFDVLPCAINREWSESQFYLVRNLLGNSSPSVYVLTSKRKEVDKLELIAKIDDVFVLIMP